MTPTSEEFSARALRTEVLGYNRLLNDWQITNTVKVFNMVEPFEPNQVKSGVISYGLSTAGYDMRISDEFRIFTPATGNLTYIDPKNFDESLLVPFRGIRCVIPPNSFALGRSLEYFRMPRHIMGLCLGKSTYARAGVITNFTPFEPGWEGFVTIEISNTTPLPVVIHAWEGIAQVLFFPIDPPTTSYADRKGKYQNQTGITLPKVVL